jgi:hypothetical protein
MFNFLTGFGWQAKLLIIAGVFIAGLATGWQFHGFKTKASLANTLAEAEKTRQNAQKKAAKIIENKQKTLYETKVVYRTIKDKIHEENDTRICFADANALQLWNDAINGTHTDRTEPAREARADGAIESQQADQEGYIATVEQVLNNAATNFQICNENDIKHNALIDSIKSLDGKMCVLNK